MTTRALSSAKGFHFGPLLRGDADVIAVWIEERSARRMQQQLLTIVVGAGAFGAAMGCWRDTLQGGFTAIKLPLILLLTASGNALINGMFAPLLGLGLGMRESFAAVLTSFSLAATVLGAFSPLVFFLVWNLPPLAQGAAVSPAVHAILLIVLAGVIGFAGITANLRLMQLLKKLGGSAEASWRILFAWLFANLLLGSQLSWILRPFIGAPGLPVQFLRADAFHGSFFETLFSAASGLFS